MIQICGKYGDGAELASLKRLIVEKIEGTPLFMEETVQLLLDEGALARDGSAVKLTKPLAELKIRGCKRQLATPIARVRTRPKLDRKAVA